MADEGIITKPIDLVRFVGIENENFMISLANNPDELKVINHLQGLYNAAMSDVEVHENQFVIFQLLTFTHYHFLCATAAQMRRHLSESFASGRVAIDAALIAAQIIHDRPSQVAYANRTRPFDKLVRHFKNMVDGGKPLPHRLIPDLIELHGKISAFANHADIASFVHRVKMVDGEKPIYAVEYFQAASNKAERKLHAMQIFHIFVMVLDVFADFLVREQKVVPERWKQELYELGGAIGGRIEELKKDVPPESMTGMRA
jgi:hypothetical protein